MERWDNRLTGDQSLVESYIEVRLSIALYCHIAVAGKRRVLSTVIKNSAKVENTTAVAFSANVSDRNHRHYWKQEPMFVNDVQVVQCVERIIPSSVRLYLC